MCEVKKTKSVMWTEEKDWDVFLEPEELFLDLKKSRLSNLNQRRADRERMERTLAPILTKQHRYKVYHRLYHNKLE